MVVIDNFVIIHHYSQNLLDFCTSQVIQLNEDVVGIFQMSGDTNLCSSPKDV